MTVRVVTATRYVTPLREGGSLPAIAEGDDLGTYVLKFRGAGQGPKVLIAELVAGEIGRGLGLPVPEIVLKEVDPALGRSEPDFEIQDLIKASPGMNLALDYLPGSFAFDPLLTPPPDSTLASAIVWFDAYISNVDRTIRNTNMLIWHRQLYLIDHGSALYVHHSGSDFARRSRDPFPQIRDHVLLPLAAALTEADSALAPRISGEMLEEIMKQIPDLWLEQQPGARSAEEQRAAYVTYLLDRLEAPRAFVEEAVHARAQLV